MAMSNDKKESLLIQEHEFFTELDHLSANSPDIEAKKSISDDGSDNGINASGLRMSSMHTIRYSEADHTTSKDMPKFHSKSDLIRYQTENNGGGKLTSFLIPDIAEL